MTPMESVHSNSDKTFRHCSMVLELKQRSCKMSLSVPMAGTTLVFKNFKLVEGESSWTCATLFYVNAKEAMTLHS